MASFRRQAELIHAHRAEWHQWRAKHTLDISVAELPDSVIENEKNWWYFLDRG